VSSSDVLLYGLRVRSEVPLPQGLEVVGAGEPDLELSLGPETEPTMARPEGHLMAAHELSETAWYHFVRRPDGSYFLRYSAVCDFEVSADLKRATIFPVRGLDADRLSVFATGGLPAFVLMMRGELVLHASAVERNGAVVAFVGPSGMGKSTIAALCCSDGARLVTDDVLRIDLSDGGARCHLGASELRLRKSSGELAGLFDERPGLRGTGDGRTALAPPMAPDELFPLAAVIVPLVDREVAELSLERQAGMPALLSILSFPRLPGWADAPSQAVYTERLTALVNRIPVYVANVPWGPPFPPDLASQLFEQLGLSG
jgi:hypothetical protein